MSKKQVAVLGILAIIVLLGGVYLWGPSSVPPGQEALVTLSDANFRQFETAFDAKPAESRLVLLLSPT